MKRFLRGWAKRPPRQVYLTEVQVAPHRSWVGWIEKTLLTQVKLNEAALREAVEAVLALQPVAGGGSAQPGDLGLEVRIEDCRFGGLLDGHFGAWGLMLLWRPRVRISARLFNLESGKTKSRFRLARHMPWGTFLPRALSSMFSWWGRPPAAREDLFLLLRIACKDLMVQVRRTL